jgi:hypothetical protein
VLSLALVGCHGADPIGPSSGRAAGILMTILGVALFAAWLGEAEKRVKLMRSELLKK